MEAFAALTVGCLLGSLNINKKKVDYVARTKVCNALQDYYTKERLTSYHYDWCLQYGPTDMMSYHKTQFQTPKFEPKTANK